MTTKSEAPTSDKSEVRGVPPTRRLLLAIDVPPENVEIVSRMLATVRSGLVSPHMTTDGPPLALSHEGPYELTDLDTEIIAAMASYYEHDEGPESDEEPHIVAGRATLAAARYAAAMVHNLPLPSPGPRQPGSTAA